MTIVGCRDVACYVSTSRLLRLVLILAVVMGTAGWAEAIDATPLQPGAVAAFHRDGQTFVTWTERGDLARERYRIYRSGAPITPASLGNATLLGEVGEGSAIFFANRYADYESPAQWHVRTIERYVVDDLGPELAAGTGLFVWTTGAADPAGPAYYAVTAVLDGVENTADFSPGNTTGPLAEAVGRPRPVHIASTNGWEVYVQFRDLRNWNPTFHAPNPLNDYYGLAATDYGVPGSLQYAYDTAVYVPDAAQCGGSLPPTLPVFLSLHGGAFDGDRYDPPTNSRGDWCAYILAPIDQSETWWFGFARDHDYRTGGAPEGGDVIANYTEQRVLDMLDFLLRTPPGPPADPRRVYVNGYSMGGGGSLAMALRYPAVFAAANASKPVTDFGTLTPWIASLGARWGAIDLNLPVQVSAPNGWADHLRPFTNVGVWDWQNLQAGMTRLAGQEIAPFSADFGINDDNVPWTTQGAPFFGSLEASNQPWAARVTNDDHTWGEYGGLGPNYRLDAAGAPFAGFSAVRDESVPGFSQVSSDPLLPPQAAGDYHRTLYWSASWAPWDGAPVDTPEMWRTSLCTVADASQPVCGTGGAVTANVTLRRLQALTIKPLMEYMWEVRDVVSDEVVARGTVRCGADGVITVPGVPIAAGGVRLEVRPGDWVADQALFLPLAADD